MKRTSLLVLTMVAMIATCAAQAPSGAREALSMVKSDFFTTSDGVRIHYIDAGKGPAMVFIPGWTMPACIWEKQIAHFAPKHRVIAVDPRSQGESDKPPEGNYPERRARDYKELVDYLKLSPVVLVGWSMGVPEIMAYVNQFGASDLKAVVLVDGFVVLDDAMSKNFQGLVRLMVKDRKKFTDGFIPSMYKTPQPDTYYQRLTADSLKTPTNTAAELLIVAHTDWSSALPWLAQTPVLFVVTSNLARQLDVVRAAIPNVHAEVFEDSHHALFADNAERFNAIVQRFIEGAPAR